MPASLLPVVKIQFNGTSGDYLGKPLAGGKLYTYVAGAYTTLKDTYTDDTAGTANSNPVILDSNGMANIWIDGYYNIRLYDANDVLQYSEANVSSAPSSSGLSSLVNTQWLSQTLPSLTYSSGTVFTCATDKTATFVAGGRIQATVTAGTVIGTIVSSAHGSITTVTCVWDSGALDSGLSAVATGIISVLTNCLPITPVPSTVSGNKTFTIADINKFFVFNGTGTPTATLPAPSTVPSGSWITIKYIGVGVLEVTGIIDKDLAAPTSATISLNQNESLTVTSNGTYWFAQYSGRTTPLGSAAYVDTSAFDAAGTAASLIASSSVSMETFSYSLGDSSRVKSYTGAGFRPSAVMILAGIDSAYLNPGFNTHIICNSIAILPSDGSAATVHFCTWKGSTIT